MGNLKRPRYIIGMSSVSHCNQEARGVCQDSFAFSRCLPTCGDAALVRMIGASAHAPVRAQMLAAGADAAYIKWDMPQWHKWSRSE